MYKRKLGCLSNEDHCRSQRSVISLCSSSRRRPDVLCAADCSRNRFPVSRLLRVKASLWINRVFDQSSTQTFISATFLWGFVLSLCDGSPRLPFQSLNSPGCCGWVGSSGGEVSADAWFLPPPCYCSVEDGDMRLCTTLLYFPPDSWNIAAVTAVPSLFIFSLLLHVLFMLENSLFLLFLCASLLLPHSSCSSPISVFFALICGFERWNMWGTEGKTSR